ncbi:hypothetical protein P3X46_033972 [Hevea brasiliensis]|uniref:Uncharacterized protein n=1 Tax=Hevea brasiliensis TaxID=3981 RepID=A0ABQ9K977_HEVBR|nr:uncharacterized protein LOC131176596 [Hevea brasiliensis]KAJ9129242.1 hypothetical protein P3X46_033972 [Hevea brasiliensis]
MKNSLIGTHLSQIQKRFLRASAIPFSSNSPLPTATSSQSFTVQHLVNSCGIPLESALSDSRKRQVDENHLQRAQSVLEVLKAHNFTDTHVARLISKQPQVLHCRVSENLQPKFEYLMKNGFVGELLPELIVSNPIILRRALDTQIKPSFELLRSYLYSNDKIVSAMKRSSWLLTFNLKGTIQPNMDFLKKEGVPPHILENLIKSHPRTLMQKHHRMVYAVNTVKNLGLKSTSGMFIHAVRVMISMSEYTWKKKIELMKSFGWCEEEILSAFVREPLCLACSEEKIKNVMDFYMNTMKLEPHTIIAYPKFLMYAVDKRLRPRYDVLKVLESKEPIEGNRKIGWLFTISEKKFLTNYVNRYADEVPGLLEMYVGAKKSKKLGTS